MTRQRCVELGCPKCGGKQNATVYDSINVSLDPSLKEKLFHGEVNRFRCKECRENVFVSILLLYHDMEKNLLVQFYPFHALEHKEFLEQFSKEGEWSSVIIGKIPRRLREPYKRVHIVSDMEELIRYVTFREKLHETWKKAN